MAKNVNILLKLTDQFSPKLKGTTKEIKEQKRQLNAATGVLRSWGNAANEKFKAAVSLAGKAALAFATLGGALSIAGIKSFAEESMELAKTQVQAEVLLENALANVDALVKNGTGAISAAKEELIDYASSLQKIGIIGDEVTLSGMQQLATSGLDTNQIKVLSGAMDDLIAKQYGLEATADNAIDIAKKLAKAMTGSAGELAENGIILSDTEIALLAVADGEQRAANLAKILEDRVGGVNAALAGTDQGKIQQAANAWGDFKEEVGKKLLGVKAELADKLVEYLPTIQEKVLALTDVIIEKIGAVVNWAEEHKAKIKSALDQIESVVTKVFSAASKAFDWMIKHGDTLIPILAGIVAGFTAFNILSTIIPLVKSFIVVIQGAKVAGGLLNAVIIASPLGFLCSLIALAVTAGVLLYKNWDTIKAKAQALWDKISSVFSRIKTTVVEVKDAFVNAFAAIRDKIGGIISSITTKLQPLINFVNTVKNGLSNLKSILSSGFDTPANPVQNWSDHRRNALGTPYFPGGVTGINEGGRGETVILPSGTQIIPHDVAVKQQPTSSTVVNITVQGNLIGNRAFLEQAGEYVTQRIIAARGVV